MGSVHSVPQQVTHGVLAVLAILAQVRTEDGVVERRAREEAMEYSRVGRECRADPETAQCCDLHVARQVLQAPSIPTEAVVPI